MSASTREVHDPLRALREADHRPVLVIWRERLASRLRALVGLAGQPEDATVSGRFIGALVAAALVFFGWQTYVASDPPVEDSLPFASPEATSPPSTATAEAPAGAATASAPSSAAPSSEAVVVHVAGAVVRSGVVVGESSWRVHDAIAAAGGAADRADVDRLNLAAPVEDGQRIYVPLIGEDDVPVVVDDRTAESGSDEGALININAAPEARLEELPGVGPVTAAAIARHRDEHGSFASVDALVAVRGIGPTTVEGLRDFATAG